MVAAAALEAAASGVWVRVPPPLPKIILKIFEKIIDKTKMI